MTSSAPTILLISLGILFSSTFFPDSNSRFDSLLPFTLKGENPSPDTMVNYCRLVRAAYFYGQKSTENKPVLDPGDLKNFNDQWKDVFDVPFYQTGITADEFSLAEPRFREGNHQPFPPSVRYQRNNADTYILFHVAKEVGRIKSQAFTSCPACIQQSIDKINALLQGTTLYNQVSQIWVGPGVLKKINSVQDINDLWIWLRCLMIDDRVNPVSMQLFVSLPPVVKCPDTTIITCKDEIKPKVTVGYRHCEIGGKVDTIGPMLKKGRDNCPGAVYAFKFIARDQCLKKDSAWQYFRIKNDGPSLINPPADTMVECIEYYRKHKLQATSSCNLPAKVKMMGPKLVSGKHNCPYAVYEMQYIAHDTCGRDNVFKQRITIQNDDPAIECPPDTMVECIEYFKPGHPHYELSCYHHYAELITSTPRLIRGRANCDSSIYEVTYTLTDSCDRKATCIQHVTIHHGPPHIECPPNEEVLCEEDIRTGTPRSVHVFCKLGYDIHISDPVLIIGKRNCTGAVYSVTYTIVDACGRRDSCEQLFTILQPEVLIDCPDDVTVLCEKDIKPTDPSISIACKRHYTVTHSELSLISGKRNCDNAIYSIIYTVTDDCGTIKTCEQKFIIIQPDPEIVCPPEVTVDCDNLHTFDVPVPAIGCGLGYTSARSEPVLVSGKVDCDGSRYKTTYSITDECGRTATCDFYITLHVPMPQIWCAKNENVDCEKDIIPTDPRVTTSCNHIYTVAHTNPVLTKGIKDCAGAEYKITYTVTDDCGRTLKCDQYFTLTHGTINIGCPPDQEINCVDEIFEDPPTVQWGCKEGTVTHGTPYREIGTPNCPGAVYALKYTATDQCGTTAICVQRFTIRDNDMTVICPNDTVVTNPIDIKPSKIPVTSPCDNHPKVKASQPSLVEGVAGTDGAVYQIDYTITDDCQRHVECYQQFTLIGADCDPYPGTTAKWDDAAKKWVCVCEDGFEWDQVRKRCVPFKPDCTQYPGSVMAWNEQKGMYECQCASGYEWDQVHNQCIPFKPDCTQYPGSTMAWNEQKGMYECQCPTGYEWDQVQNQCVPFKPDCAQFPGSVMVWNEQKGMYECQCESGYVWDQTQYKCVPQIPDCSAYPGTSAVWDANQGKYVCSCAQGYVWDQNQYKCVPQIPDCSVYPGTSAVWDANQGKYVCSCAQGYVWDQNQYKCVPQIPDCSAYPGTSAVWDANQGKYVCSCTQGYVWDQNQYKCVPQLPDCSAYTGTSAVWDANQGKYVCSCAQGYVWDQNQYKCVPSIVCTIPNSSPAWNAQTQQYECYCNTGYTWNGTACITAGNSDTPVVNPQQQKQGNCNVVIHSGANEPEQYTIDVHGVTGTVQFSYSTYDVKDRIHVYYGGSKIFDSGCVGTSSSTSFTLNGYTSVFIIIVDPQCESTENTAWDFTLGCPQ